MNWKEVKININQEAAEAVANILEEAGAGGVVLAEDDGRTEITAYYPADQGFAELFQQIRERTNKLTEFGLNTGQILISSSLTGDQDWATSWHKYFKPIAIGERFVICPSWETCPEDNAEIIKIDPGMAFGVGSHETTRLSVILLEKHIDQGEPSVLDIGTGTGILSIAAARSGADQVLGVDIDPAAVAAAEENIRINRVEERVKIKKGDLTSDISGEFTLILANLLPDLIRSLLPSIPGLMAANGRLILSGITRGTRNEIVSLLSGLQLNLIDEISENEWVSLVVKKG